MYEKYFWIANLGFAIREAKVEICTRKNEQERSNAILATKYCKFFRQPFLQNSQPPAFMMTQKPNVKSPCERHSTQRKSSLLSNKNHSTAPSPPNANLHLIENAMEKKLFLISCDNAKTMQSFL